MVVSVPPIAQQNVLSRWEVFRARCRQWIELDAESAGVYGAGSD